MQNIISVDFLSLYPSADRLWSLSEKLGDINIGIKKVLNMICGMTVGDAEDELLYNIHRLLILTEQTEAHSMKLKKILGLYEECENELVSMVEGLADISDCFDSLKSSENNAGTIFNDKIGIISPAIFDWFVLGQTNALTLPETSSYVYSGKTVLNESWLDEIVFGEVNLDE